MCHSEDRRIATKIELASGVTRNEQLRVLAVQRTKVQFPAPPRWLAAAFNSFYRGPKALLNSKSPRHTHGTHVFLLAETVIQ